MPNQPAPAAKVHLDTELNTAKTFLNLYRDVYPKDITEQGIVYTLVGYVNYLATSGGVAAATVTGSAALAALKTAGYV